MSTVHESVGFSTLVGTPAQVRRSLEALPQQEHIVLVTFECESEARAARLGEAANLVLKFVDDALLDLTSEQLQIVVNTLVPRAPPSPARLIEAKMLANARKAVLESGDWMTAAQLAQVAGLSPTNPSTQPNKWKQARKIFAISHQGLDYFPSYGLDGEGRPLKGLALVLDAFGKHKDGWGLAYWFSSVNSFLGGKRPQDVLAVDPGLVVAAAKDEIEGVLHG